MSSFNGIRRVPPPINEPVRSYAPGSPERAELKTRLAAMADERLEIPLIIGGKDVRTGDRAEAVMPHDHRHVLADWHKAGPEHVLQAIEAAQGRAARVVELGLGGPRRRLPARRRAARPPPGARP